jgi:hypothetical protein
MLRAASALSVASGAGATYGYHKIKSDIGDEAMGRILSFYQVALPAVRKAPTTNDDDVFNSETIQQFNSFACIEDCLTTVPSSCLQVVEYKALEFKCEVLPTLLPQLFPSVSEEEEAALFVPLHEKWTVPVVEKFFELGGKMIDRRRGMHTYTSVNPTLSPSLSLRKLSYQVLYELERSSSSCDV